jgi:hypothetical protein
MLLVSPLLCKKWFMFQRLHSPNVKMDTIRVQANFMTERADTMLKSEFLTPTLSEFELFCNTAT